MSILGNLLPTITLSKQQTTTKQSEIILKQEII